MNKVTYWLRKVGILRTSSYKVSGDAEKLNKVQASDDGMVQSQKEIDEKYKEKNTINNTEELNSPNNEKNNSKGLKSKILFWIFLVLGIILSILVLLIDFSVWFILTVVMWGWFLRKIWKNTTLGSLMIGKTIFIGIILVILSLFFIDAALPGPEEARKEHDEFLAEMDEVIQDQEKEQQEVAKKDKIVKFLLGLEDGTGIAFGKVIADDDALWTSTNIALIPTDAKIMATTDVSDKSWAKVKQYFEDHKGHHGTIGFEFVDKSDDKQVGYLFDAGEYAHLMCILTKTQKKMGVSCGWGPGGGK